MLKRIEVTNLNGRFSFKFNLNPDLNLFTGKNGCGKTTLLKLIYYIISGNLEKLIPEITFDRVYVAGESYEVEINIFKNDKNQQTAKIDWMAGGKKMSAKVLCKDFQEDSKQLHPVDIDIAGVTKGSIFFPTFRRIEGGFTIPKSEVRFRSVENNELQEALKNLARTLTFQEHVFVSSLSTDDIETLLTDKYAGYSKRAIKLQTVLSEAIEKEIKGFKDSENYTNDPANLQNARRILSEIQHQVQELEAKRSALFKPFETLRVLVGELMHDKGIKVKEIVTFGDIGHAVDSAQLSAGEKQMLSFLCYNAFANKHIILIDEPEISLHVDWQRVLFS